MTTQERIKKFEQIEEIEKDLAFWAGQFVNCKKMNFEKEGEKAFEKMVELVEIKNKIWESCFDK